MRHSCALSLFGAWAVLSAGCSSTFDCGSSDVVEVLSQSPQRLVAESDAAFQKQWEIPVSETVNYSFREIRTLAHDESTDTFQCAANFVTATADGQNTEREVRYEVSPVVDPDAEFQIREEDSTIDIAMRLALEARNARLSEPMVAEKKRGTYIANLKYYRDGADAAGENDYAAALRNMGAEVPPRTPEQDAKFRAAAAANGPEVQAADARPDATSAASVDACTEKKIEDYRAEVGPDQDGNEATIRDDQVTEWRNQCETGA